MDSPRIQATPAVPRSCGANGKAPGGSRIVKWAAAGGLLASVGICAACCLLPFSLIALGVTGAWVGTLDALAPYKWLFIILTVALLGYGFYAVYWKARPACTAGANCQTCGSGRAVKRWLWIATVLAVGGVIFEQIEPLIG